MTDLLHAAVQWLAGQCRQHLARTVEYQRGAQSANLPAGIGLTTFEQTDEYGVVTRIESRDFLVAVADLVLGGQSVEPARGDRIIETDTTGTHTYEVMAPGDEPPWRYSDPYRQMYRIHTKEIAEV